MVCSNTILTTQTASPLQMMRTQYVPELPPLLQKITHLQATPGEIPAVAEKDKKQLASLFPHTFGKPLLRFMPEKSAAARPLTVGVVLSGGQAPGGHNVIAGLFDALQRIHPESKLYGFLGGPKGIVENKTIPLTSDQVRPYRNQGGFDLIGSGRTKIETPEQFQAAERTARALDLDGLVIIGGDDSNTNAALLAEYFLSTGCKTCVVGVPKTIDGDLKNAFIATSFGFDTACKTYSEIIGNIARDALSAGKYYFFIKMMGRSASHVTLECALQTHPNIALIGEEILSQKKKLAEVVNDIADMICERASQGKDYGVVLVPEGIIEFIPEMKKLISELQALDGQNVDVTKLSAASAACFQLLPQEIQQQLLMDRDPHGNVQVSKIETERLLIDMVANELKRRKAQGTYAGKFSPQPFFCGYEGRSCLPSNFDCQYCYALGFAAALLIANGVTGYMSSISGLARPVGEWTPCGVPLTAMMTLEQRHGKAKPVIRKSLVELDSKVFALFKEQRDAWRQQDAYRYPGPIQFFGPAELTDAVTTTLTTTLC